MNVKRTIFIPYQNYLYDFTWQNEVANAWKIKKDEPVTVRLHMNLTSYLDAKGKAC